MDEKKKILWDNFVKASQEYRSFKGSKSDIEKAYDKMKKAKAAYENYVSNIASERKERNRNGYKATWNALTAPLGSGKHSIFSPDFNWTGRSTSKSSTPSTKSSTPSTKTRTVVIEVNKPKIENVSKKTQEAVSGKAEMGKTNGLSGSRKSNVKKQTKRKTVYTNNTIIKKDRSGNITKAKVRGVRGSKVKTKK